ncbi:efflux RND transporter permease subunit [Aliikangiella maris]|uniref:Efflux RND transporter permease subunit n=2 Tax=Aliikangiella maris TaxID=3162458 RepID=A0ABV3MUD3_9GAMM
MGALKIPVQMIPDLEVRTISVITGWPGATPQDVEKEILIEQERYLRTIPNLKRMTSYAEMGEASIEMEFPFGIEVNDALLDVNNALSQVPSYPENVDQPRILANSFSNNAFMYFTLRPQKENPLKLDMDLVRDYAEDYIRPRMETVPGISEVRVGGGAARQIQIKIDPAKLAQRGISITQVRNAIRVLRSIQATIIGLIGIPLCTIAAFLGLLLFDRTINVISLAGVAFAIGMTVDNAIVVLESIMQAKHKGVSRFKAAIIGVQDVWPAVLASTATTVLVFAPILFVQQEAGQLYSDYCDRYLRSNHYFNAGCHICCPCCIGQSQSTRNCRSKANSTV